MPLLFLLPLDLHLRRCRLRPELLPLLGRDRILLGLELRHLRITLGLFLGSLSVTLCLLLGSLSVTLRLLACRLFVFLPRLLRNLSVPLSLLAGRLHQVALLLRQIDHVGIGLRLVRESAVGACASTGCGWLESEATGCAASGATTGVTPAAGATACF